MRIRALLAVIGITFVSALACAGGGEDLNTPEADGSGGSTAGPADSYGNGSPPGSGPGASKVCVAFSSNACECPGGGSGIKQCNGMGTGYSACEGCGPAQDGGSEPVADAGSGLPSCQAHAQSQGWNVYVCQPAGGNQCDGIGEATSDCERCCPGPSCGQVANAEGWTGACEKNGNGACNGQGFETWDCDYCCDASGGTTNPPPNTGCTDSCSSGQMGCYSPSLGWKCEQGSDGCWSKKQISCKTSDACYNSPQVCIEGPSCTSTCSSGQLGCYSPTLGWKCVKGSDGCWSKKQISCKTSDACYTSAQTCVDGPSCSNTCSSGDTGCYSPTLGWKCAQDTNGCWVKKQMSCKTADACYSSPDTCVNG